MGAQLSKEITRSECDSGGWEQLKNLGYGWKKRLGY